MLPLSPASILALVVLQGSPVSKSTAPCEDVQRIELNVTPTPAAREVCVSPGLMTGFLFDTIPTSLELQDEVRFAEVFQGRSGISFVPPEKTEPGERLRLTARLGTGALQETVTFILVAHRGQATRQVEVFRDRRTRESYQQEVEQTHAKNQQLQKQNQLLAVQLDRAQGLRGLITTQMMGVAGVQALSLGPETSQQEGEASTGNTGLIFKRGLTFRTETTIAAEVWILNDSPKAWSAIGASLKGANGEELVELKLRQEGEIARNAIDRVIVEAEASIGMARGQMVLTLWDAEAHVISIPRIRFP